MHSVGLHRCINFRSRGAGVSITQEADSPNCSTSMPKVVVGVPRVLKAFSWGFIYIFQFLKLVKVIFF